MPESLSNKPGNVGITKIGHTTGTKFGMDPSVQEKGGAGGPTPITFGKGGK